MFHEDKGIIKEMIAEDIKGMRIKYDHELHGLHKHEIPSERTSISR